MEYLQAAVEYVARGWPVFPLQVGQKLPLRGTKGLLEATTANDSLQRWWAQAPYNVGIATGSGSGLFVLDIDPRHGGDKNIKKLQEIHGRLPDTVAVATGGGGVQFYFKHQAGLTNSANKIGLGVTDEVDEKQRPVTGIDTRGEGGYVVAPPSLHPSGRHYQFYKGRAPHDLPLADIPPWIVQHVQPTAGGDRGRVADLPKQLEKYRDLIANGVGEGARNDSLTRLAGFLFRSRLDPLIVYEILRLWNQSRVSPPIDGDEFERTVNSVAGKELARINKRRTRK